VNTRNALIKFRSKFKKCEVIFDLDGWKKRIAELEHRLNDQSLWKNAEEAKKLNKEFATLKDQLERFNKLVQDVDDIRVLLELIEEEPEEGLERELKQALAAAEKEVERWQVERLFAGEHDQKDAILSINAGAGGTEAQDWANMLLRMYLRYCQNLGFAASVVDLQPGEEAGIKSAMVTVQGNYAYGWLRPERGVHRLVRISPFDANKRRHTSFAAVFVMPDIEEEIDVVLKDEDLKIDFFRASGPGGQHVNKASTAVRITHLPSGIVVQCQNERSQHQNRATALKILKARLYEREQAERREKIEKEFLSDKKDIEWGSQIRSYVLQPYQLVKDLRTGVETGNVQAVLDGELEQFVLAYLKKEASERK
jgi:peptide chain release factor 2